MENNYDKEYIEGMKYGMKKMIVELRESMNITFAMYEKDIEKIIGIKKKGARIK